jgi:hypothetical protein
MASPDVGGWPHREDRAPRVRGWKQRVRELFQRNAPAEPGLQLPEENRPGVSQRRVGHLQCARSAFTSPGSFDLAGQEGLMS